MATNSRAGTGTNQEAVRRHNLGTLLRNVHQRGASSRAELTKDMGLNRSTIAGLVAELEALGAVANAAAVGTSRGAGRPSVGVRIAPDGPFVVAIDLGVDRVVAARVGLGGVVRERAETIGAGSEAWQVGSIVAGLVRHVVAEAPATSPMVGIGISVPGMVRRSDGLIRLAPNLDWHDVSFGGIVLAALGVDVPVSLGNDADLGAVAEHQRGAGVGVDDLIYISGNVGVGAGVISGGKRLEGAGGYAGEIGHLRFNPAGKLCHCGNVGCWETEVGAHAIAEAIRCPQDRVPQLWEVLYGYEKAPRELRSIGTAIGQGLSTLVNVFNPQVVVMGGYFDSMYTLVRREIDEGLAERALPAALESVALTVPALGRDSVLLGAAEMAFEPLFVDPVTALGSALQDVGPRVAG